MKPDHSHDQVIAARRAELSRRRFLRGMGISMALPAFESMLAKGAGAAMAGSTLPAPYAPIVIGRSGAPEAFNVKASRQVLPRFKGR